MDQNTRIEQIDCCAISLINCACLPTDRRFEQQQQQCSHWQCSAAAAIAEPENKGCAVKICFPDDWPEAMSPVSDRARGGKGGHCKVALGQWRGDPCDSVAGPGKEAKGRTFEDAASSSAAPVAHASDASLGPSLTWPPCKSQASGPASHSRLQSRDDNLSARLAT